MTDPSAPSEPASDGRAGLRRAGSALRSLFERDLLVLAAILAAAAAVRYAGLEARGRFDGDQGHDMLVLLGLVRDGAIPLLGPPTSIGDVHHGAAYYYLLAPAAWLSGVNPTAVVAWIAAMGVAAVGVTWWFARSVGGRVPAAIAGALMTVSPAAIEESTFIWNPNPIPLFAALALGCGWRAHALARPRWWIPALFAAGMVGQLHILGVVFLPPILALAAADVVRARRAGDGARAAAILRAAAVGLLLVALLFVPLVIHELGSDFAETRRAAAYLASGGDESRLGPIGQLAITLLRLVGWPLVGLVTDAPGVALVAVGGATVLAVWLLLAGDEGARGDGVRDGSRHGSLRVAARWLGLSVLWSGITLAVLAPSLGTVVPGLPNDHYHAFIDPVVIVLVGLATHAVVRRAGARSARLGGAQAARLARAGVTVALGALVLVDIWLTPPADPDGGWPAAREAGIRVAEAAAGTRVDVRGLPIFKTAEGVSFAVVAAGGDAIASTDEASALRPLEPDATIVIACDRLFEAVMGAACGGPAEADYLRRLAAGPIAPEVSDRFDLSPRIAVTVIRR